MSEAETFPAVEGMTVAHLLEAVALNSEQAVVALHEPYLTDTDGERQRDKARRHYGRRNDCMAELQRRFDAAGIAIGEATGVSDEEREAIEQTVRSAEAWADMCYTAGMPQSGQMTREAVAIARPVLRRLANGDPS